MKGPGSFLVLVAACGTVSAPPRDGGGDGAPPGGDFTLAAASGDTILRQGGSLAVDVTITRGSGFEGAVEVAASDLPTGVTAAPITIPAGATNGSLALEAAADATQGGPFTAVVTGTSGSLAHGADVSFLVGGAPGTLDQSFAGGGRLTARIGGVGTVGRGMRLQPDGKIVVTSATNSGQAATMRLNADGSYDTSFGSGGFVSTGMGATSGGIDVEILDDGRIVVGGWSGAAGDTDYTLFGYTSAGVLDTSFGAGGIALFSVPGTGYAEIHRLLVDSTGSLLALGATFSSPSVSHLLRYDGTTNAIQGPGSDSGVYLETGLVLGDGKILAAGGNSQDYWLTRYTSALVKDGTFDGDGIVTTDHDTLSDTAHALFELGGGRVLAVGISSAVGTGGAVPRISFAAYNSNGSLDLTFGSGGRVVGPDSALGSRAPTFAAMDAQGRIVLVGYERVTGQPIAVARYDATGAIDATFGSSGIASIDFGLANGTTASGYGVAIDDHGRIVLSAAVGPNADGSIGVARLWP